MGTNQRLVLHRCLTAGGLTTCDLIGVYWLKPSTLWFGHVNVCYTNFRACGALCVCEPAVWSHELKKNLPSPLWLYRDDFFFFFWVRCILCQTVNDDLKTHGQERCGTWEVGPEQLRHSLDILNTGSVFIIFHIFMSCNNWTTQRELISQNKELVEILIRWLCLRGAIKINVLTNFCAIPPWDDEMVFQQVP